jgi:hypothetical protein
MKEISIIGVPESGETSKNRRSENNSTNQNHINAVFMNI